MARGQADHSMGCGGQKSGRKSGVRSGEMSGDKSGFLTCAADTIPRFSELPDGALSAAVADVDPSACRALWAEVLRHQWLLVFEPLGADTEIEQRRARTWFGSRDFRMICDFAGVDPVAVLARFRARVAVMDRDGKTVERKQSVACKGKGARLEVRRREIKAMHEAGHLPSQSALARAFGVSARCICNDFAALNLTVYHTATGRKARGG